MEFLARTGLRKGEFLDLAVDSVVQIGAAYWLHVPLGKLRTDRYIPLHPQLKDLLDAWLAARPTSLRSLYLFVEHGQRIGEGRVDRAVAKAAKAAGIEHVSPHRLRHTLATQAKVRGIASDASLNTRHQCCGRVDLGFRPGSARWSPIDRTRSALPRGDIALTHEALDAHPARRAADYLRAMLVAHGALPPRDEPLARLERAAADLLAHLPAGEDRRTLTAYATWRILHRARRRARIRPTSTAATGHATLRLRAAIALLEWLRSNDIQLSQLRQADVDQWLLTGPLTLRREIVDFLGWATARKLTPPLTLAHAAHREGAALSEEDYWRLAYRLLHDPDIAGVDRVAGSFVLLYGQQLARVAAMTRDQVHDRGDTMSIRFGIADIEIPEPLAGFVRGHLRAPRRHTSIAAPPDSTWLFPGHLPGRPITPSRLGERLAQLGIDSQTGRRAAMLKLASTVPAAVLTDLLGIHTTTAADWAHAAGGDWSHYAAEIARTATSNHAEAVQ